jgi:uracil-DNA glycosylase family 4
MPSLCPNHHPAIPPDPNRRLAVVGTSPVDDDVVAQEPFSSTGGRFLRAILGNCGIATNRIFYGNVCQTPTPTNLTPDHPSVLAGMAQLTDDLAAYQPNCTLLLGSLPFQIARPDLCYPTKSGFHIPLSDWRGSIFTSPPFGKSVATYHPIYVQRSYNDFPFFLFDVNRAVTLSGDPTFHPRVAHGIHRPLISDVLSFLTDVSTRKTPITFDIEGYPDVVGITMLSIVPTADPLHGIVIPFRLGGHYWTEDEEVQIWTALSAVLADPNIPKTAHNCFYELFVFAWRHRCIINNLHDDTMMAHWENYPEFAGSDKEERRKVSATQKKRSLGLCASIYTEQQFYKDDRTSNDPNVKLNYSFLDSSVTAEIRNCLTQRLQAVPASYQHYRFNINLIPAYNYIMLRGCRFDVEKARVLAASVSAEIEALNLSINTTLDQRGVFGSFPVSKANEKHRSRDGFNVKSSDQKCWLLYDHLKYKPVTKWGRTGDEDALLHFWKKDQDPLLRLVIQAVRKRTRLSDIEKLIPDPDGRIRCAYDIVGTNTGRISSRKSMSMVLSPDGDWINTGSNLQNQTKDLRVCYTSDSPDHLFFQCDLSGADAWTVAAELAALGHPVMLEDMLFGIKPSLVLCHMVREHEAGRDVRAINSLTRPELKSITKSIRAFFSSVEGKTDPSGRPLDWLYLCSKRGQHGSNYDMRSERITELVFGDSDGSVVLSKKDAELYQYLYKLRYKTDARNEWIRKTLSETTCITSSCGVRRKFFGIRNRRDIDDAIVREASSFNPQCNTTYLTNVALAKLYYDPRNRRSSGALFVEPIIQIHDALAGQFRSNVLPFARDSLTTWFSNPLKIANTMINIPFEGNVGPDWKNCTTPL